MRGNELRDKIEERGERSLGMKCWQEFHTIGSAYAPRIAELGMQSGDAADEAAGHGP